VPNLIGGIDLEPAATGATIGGTSAAATNVVSGNGIDGINVETSCLVEGNLMGTDVTGATAVPNSVDGIVVDGPGATIGGTTAAAANVLSGNRYNGIKANMPCLIEGNFIGTDESGTEPIPNLEGGVLFEDDTGGPAMSGVTIDGNVIAFNDGPGVGIFFPHHI
jgi:hypothetical protein